MPYNIDSDIRNADWSKQVWDMYTPDGTLVQTLDQLREALPAQSDADLKHLLELPVAENMPPGLKAELARL
jgi:hypothetical protein